ncbi:unnamed protein product [Alopecurus aequalis]
MGAVLSSASRATKNYARRCRLLTAPDAAATDADWSSLPDDLLFTIMAALDIHSLRRAGAVCRSWRHAHNLFQLPALEKAPCLLYACEEYGPNDVALFCPTTNATFRVPFPGPPHHKRGFTFSCPGGFVFTTDQVGNPYLINPLTGVQATLPPASTIYDNGARLSDVDGAGECFDGIPSLSILPTIRWARHGGYLCVAISAAAEVTECTVLILHMACGRLSFAKPGDTQWTLLEHFIYSATNILYNDDDGLFYILFERGGVATLDLRGPSPSRTTIMPRAINTRKCRVMYLALGPSGQLLQIWRNWEHINTPHNHRRTYKDIVSGARQGHVDFVGKDDNEPTGTDLPHDNEPTGIDLLDGEVTTNEIVVFKVDTEGQKLVELRDIGDHALFLGRNSALCLPTKDFPMFEPNCAYLTDDCFHCDPTLRKDLGVWNIKKRSMHKIGEDVWPDLLPWLHLPAPVWIMPRF